MNIEKQNTNTILWRLRRFLKIKVDEFELKFNSCIKVKGNFPHGVVKDGGLG